MENHNKSIKGNNLDSKVDCSGSNKKKDSKLKDFFNWNKKSIEPLKSSIDPASKIATINMASCYKLEMYKDKAGIKKMKFKKGKLLRLKPILLINVY